MDKIEIPRFLLSYFDSTTILTPLNSIMGYSRVMLKGVDGPITERQQQDLEIIQYDADLLFRYWSFAIRAIRYVAYEAETHPSQVNLEELIGQCKERINRYSPSSIELQIPDKPLTVWADLLHTESIFDCIGRLTSDVYDRKDGKITVKAFQSADAINFEFELDKTDFTQRENFDLFVEPYLFVIECVMKLHKGKSTLVFTPKEKLSVSLVFPNTDQMKPNPTH